MSRPLLPDSSNRDRYRLFCEAEGNRIPLFQQAWWLDAVCQGKQWDVLLAEREGHIVGAWPFLHGSKWGFSYVLQPQLTMFTGPWLANPADHATLQSLLVAFESSRWSICMFRCSPEVTAEANINIGGFDRTPYHTHRLAPLRPLSELMAAASPLRRRDFERLSSSLSFDTAVPPTQLASLHADYFRSQGKRSVLSQQLIVNVATEAIARHHGIATGLRDSEGRLLATLFVAYDSRCAYLLLLARSSNAPRNATAVLIWHTIAHLTPLTQAFDFEGGNTPGLERFYASFGATQVPLMQLFHCRPRLLAKILHL